MQNLQEIKKEHTGKDILIVTSDDHKFGHMVSSIKRTFPQAQPCDNFPNSSTYTLRFEDMTKIVVYRVKEELNDQESPVKRFDDFFKGQRLVVINTYRFAFLDMSCFFISMNTCGKYYKATVLNRIYDVKREEMDWYKEQQRVFNTPILWFGKQEVSIADKFADFCKENEMDMFTENDGRFKINEDSVLLFSALNIGELKVEPDDICFLNPLLVFENVANNDYEGFKKMAYWFKEETKWLRLSYDGSDQWVCKF